MITMEQLKEFIEKEKIRFGDKEPPICWSTEVYCFWYFNKDDRNWSWKEFLAFVNDNEINI